MSNRKTGKVSSIQKSSFSAGLAAGMGAGFTLCLILFWIIDDLDGELEKFLIEFLAIFSSIFAAALALRGVSHSILANSEIANEQRVRKLDAARATLPLVLSEVIRSIEEYKSNLIAGDYSHLLSKSLVSSNNLQSLKECIENAKGEAKEVLIEVLLISQIIEARIRDLQLTDGNHFAIANSADKQAILRRLEELCSLQGICETLFWFARGAKTYDQRTSVYEIAARHFFWMRDASGQSISDNIAVTKRKSKILDTHALGFSDPNWLKDEFAHYKIDQI